MLTRSLSAGNNVACHSSPTKVSNHSSGTKPHQPSSSSRLLQIPPKLTTYHSCPHHDHAHPLPQHQGSYWSPAISEIDCPFEPLGTRSLISKARLSRLLLFLLQLSLTISHITLTVQHKSIEDLANLYFVLFYSSAFLTTIFSPLITARFSENFVLLSGVISAFFSASGLFIPQMGLLLAISVISGSCWGLVMVKQGLSALNLGLQYACIKDLKERKSTAADWYLWSQVALHNGALLGSMIFAGTKKLLTSPQVPLQPHLKMPCGRTVCGTSDSKMKMALFSSARCVASLNQTFKAERPSLIDDGHANGILALIAACWALTALVVLSLTYCCAVSRRKKKGQRYGGSGNHHLLDDQSSLSLNGSQASTQVFHETAISQLRQIADLLLYDHKLQTALPLVLFTGMQSAFIVTTFTKEFVLCALGDEYAGWTLATHSSAYALTLLAVYRLSLHTKRLYILCWTVIFQVGIGVVLLWWRAGNRDVPMFFIVAAVFGVAEGGFSALLTGLLVRLFCHAWTTVLAVMLAFRFLGYAMGISASLLLCITAQIYFMYAILGLALIPFGILEWKYSAFLHKKHLLEAFV